MAKHKAAWLSMLPRGLDPSKLTLDELRNFKKAHELLTEQFPGPAGVGYILRSFRFLLLFGIASVVENTYPPFTRCWKDLEQLFMHDPAFEDGLFVQGWALFDFPFGPDGQTALDYFEAFLKDTEVAAQFRSFINEARKSRLGLHQDVARTKKIAKYRELFTGRMTSAFPSVDRQEGEILLTRMIAHGDQVFLFGDPKCFPKHMKAPIEDMVMEKLPGFFTEGATIPEHYERFMKLAGPYWMSCVTKNDAVPILEPDHYLTYLEAP